MINTSKSTIIRAIQENTGITVSAEDLHKLTAQPIKHLTSCFEAYAAQAGEFGIHVYCYDNGDITVHLI